MLPPGNTVILLSDGGKQMLTKSRKLDIGDEALVAHTRALLTCRPSAPLVCSENEIENHWTFVQWDVCSHADDSAVLLLWRSKMVAIELLPEFGYVVFTAIASIFMLMYFGIKVGQARKLYGVEVCILIHQLQREQYLHIHSPLKNMETPERIPYNTMGKSH